MNFFFNKYAANSAKFSVSASSQSNESVNNMIARKAPKNICLSKSASCDIRVASVVNTKNDGEKSILTIRKKLQLSEGIEVKKYVNKVDKKRLHASNKAKSKDFKSRRQFLNMNRANKKK